MRSEAREAAFKLVFAGLFHEPNERERAVVYKKSELSEADIEFSDRIVSCVREHREELMALITERASTYTEYRIYAADRAAMLIALAEIKYFDDIPPVVSVNEATGLARKYSTERSPDFVNGILGGIINQ